MKTFKILSGSLIVLMLLCTAVFGAGPAAPVTQVQTTLKPPRLSVDLVCSYVEYFNCPCTIHQALNTEYVTDMIAVKVGNSSGVNGVEARVAVTYFDMSTRANVTVEKTVTLNANQWTKVIMVQKPLLIGKAQGVNAGIRHANARFIDPNAANNSAVQRTCGQMVE